MLNSLKNLAGKRTPHPLLQFRSPLCGRPLHPKVPSAFSEVPVTIYIIF